MTEKDLSRAAAYCSRAEHCTSELLSKMRDWQIPAEDHNAIIRYLVRERYIDHARYATAFVRDRFRFNGWGRIKIRQGLDAKAIEQEIIEQAMQEIDPRQYQAALQELLTRRLRELRTTEPLTAAEKRNQRTRLIRHAASRGFEPDEIFKALDSINCASDE